MTFCSALLLPLCKKEAWILLFLFLLHRRTPSGQKKGGRKGRKKGPNSFFRPSLQKNWEEGCTVDLGLQKYTDDVLTISPPEKMQLRGLVDTLIVDECLIILIAAFVHTGVRSISHDPYTNLLICPMSKGASDAAFPTHAWSIRTYVQ